MKTFEQIILGNHFHEGEIVGFDNNQRSVILELMELVRWETLKECAEKAEVLLPKHGGNVDKDSILSLDKNSLDL